MLRLGLPVSGEMKAVLVVALVALAARAEVALAARAEVALGLRARRGD